MLREHPLQPLFEKFIRHSRQGKRLKKNGDRINPATIANYENTLRLLFEYSTAHSRELQIWELRGDNKREFEKAKKNYANFYRDFCSFLSRASSSTNYIGHNLKIIRTFMGWCYSELGIHIGPFYKNFYVVKEDVPIITLSIEQLNFLVYDKEFESHLRPPLKRTKDAFVFGCATGVRISDLRKIRLRDIITRDGNTYLGVTAKKTGSTTLVKLPPYCIDLVTRYRKRGSGALLPVTINSRFNERIKEICELAGWTWIVGKYRKRGTKFAELKKQGHSYRFCDLVSSHTMRRTCITNMLYAGMPEYVVRKVSGHTSNSKSFFRYVDLAQKLVDSEIDKLFDRLGPAKNESKYDVISA